MSNPTYTRTQAVARIAQLRRCIGANLGLDEEYADIECLNAAEHWEWLCTAPASEIVSHRKQMLKDSYSPADYEPDRPFGGQDF